MTLFSSFSALQMAISCKSFVTFPFPAVPFSVAMKCTKFTDYKFKPCPIYDTSSCIDKDIITSCRILSQHPRIPCDRFICQVHYFVFTANSLVIFCSSIFFILTHIFCLTLSVLKCFISFVTIMFLKSNLFF